MSTVILRTFAYNAEKTLERTIQSVLSQTHGDFIWYLLDNGSTDRTGEIIHNYARQDHRIIPLKTEVNRYDTKYSIGLFFDILSRHDDSCFFCTLDSDDEYHPAFFQEMLSYMGENQLQVAACASDFIDARNNTIVGTRKLNANLILEGRDFERYFPCYYQFMRTIWGKLYSFALLRRCRFDRIYEVSYGNDTLFAMEAFRQADRAGILNKSLHRYYMYFKSVSYREFDEKRLVSDQILHELGIEYLKQYGEISASNWKFLYLVYFSGIQDTFQVISNTSVSSPEKLQAVHRLLTAPSACNLFQYLSDQEISPFKESCFKWVFSEKKFHQSQYADTAVEILKQVDRNFPYFMSKENILYLWIKIPDIVFHLVEKDYSHALERLHIWYKHHEKDDSILSKLELVLFEQLDKTPAEVFSLLMEIKAKRVYSSTVLDIDQKIKNILKQNFLLQNVSLELSQKLKRVIVFILKDNIASACECFLNISQTIEISDQDMETYLILGQNLFAVAQKPVDFIYYKKLTIAYLLEQSHYERAEKQLDDFYKRLPQDKNFSAFREILCQWKAKKPT